jgi:hypothetical protein
MLHIKTLENGRQFEAGFGAVASHLKRHIGEHSEYNDFKFYKINLLCIKMTEKCVSNGKS